MGAFRIEKRSSLVAQWLRLNASNAGGHRFNPWLGELRSHATQLKKKKRKFLELNKNESKHIIKKRIEKAQETGLKNSPFAPNSNFLKYEIETENPLNPSFFFFY